MTNDDIDYFKGIADDPEFGALDQMKAEGYTAVISG